VEVCLPGGRLRGSTRNLSLGGALIEIPLPLACRTRLVLSVTLPGSRETLALDGAVRRNAPGVIAVSFERLSSRCIWSLGDFFESL
jgi:hypothetical protein